MPTLIQPSFAKGEVSPALAGRTDTAAYQVALEIGRNVIIHKAGGASNRAGLEFLAPVKNHAQSPRLVRFQFKTTDTYILEFGDLYMRVIRDDGHVLETAISVTNVGAGTPCVITAPGHNFTNGNEVYFSDVEGAANLNGRRFVVSSAVGSTFILADQVTGFDVDGSTLGAYTGGGHVARVYTLATPYAFADLGALKAVQSADVMTLTHASYPPKELSRTAHDNWALGDPHFKPSIDPPRNLTATPDANLDDDVSYTVTAIKLGTEEESLAGTAATYTPILTASRTNPVVIGATAHGLTSGTELEISSATGMIELNDRRFFLGAVTADTFELQAEDGRNYGTYGGGGKAYAASVTIAQNPQGISGVTNANPGVVTAFGHNFGNGDTVAVSLLPSVPEINNRSFVVANRTGTTFDLQEDTTHYSIYSFGSNQGILKKIPPRATKNTVTWDAVTGAGKYFIYRQKGGVFGFVGQTSLTTFDDNALTPDTSATPPQANNPFLFADSYPGASGYYEQRRVFGGSLDRPDTSFYSKTGNFSNFTRSSPGQDDDAITATLAAQEVNEIRHYVPGSDLLMLTSGVECRVNSGVDSALSASTIRQKVQSAWGSSHLKPIVIGSVILFVQDNLASVRSLGYSYTVDAYTGNDLTVLASHLFGQTSDGIVRAIADWGYSKYPDSLIHVVRSDGTAASLTFEQEQEVIAWARWDTQGSFEHVAVVRPSASVTDDAAYFVVKRFVNGNVVRYIERQHTRRFEDVRNFFALDCGATYDVPVAITGVTSANPVVVRAPAHGFSNGDEIDLSAIVWAPNVDDITGTETQPEQLNDARFTISGVTPSAFTLTGIDGSAFNAYVSGGFARRAVSTISGLFHLEGCTVAALVDGGVVRGLTVANGAITLAQKASRVHVGFPYIADIKTLKIEAPQGTIQGRQKRVVKVDIRLDKSRAVLVGPDEDNLTEMKLRAEEDYGAPTKLFTGDVEIEMKGLWNTNGQVFIRQKDPLPMTVLAIVPTLDIAD